MNDFHFTFYISEAFTGVESVCGELLLTQGSALALSVLGVSFLLPPFKNWGI